MLLRSAPLMITIAAMLAARAPVGAASGQDAAATLSRISTYVEQYYNRARSIVAQEDVMLQPLDLSLSSQGFPRRVQNELRIEWDPSATNPEDRARVIRTLIKAAGPALFKPGEEKCADPQSLTPEPLAFLLPYNQSDWMFTPGKGTRIDGHDAITLEYVQRQPRPVAVSGNENCVYVDLTGHTRGRLWADSESGEVLRIDEWLTGPVDIDVPREFRKHAASHVVYDREMTSVHYKRVTFTDPDETMLLPVSIESLAIYTGDSVTRLRTTQRFSKYRRFVTETRIFGASQ